MEPESEIDIDRSWEWVKQAVAKLASEEPERVGDIVQKIVETIRKERPDLLVGAASV